MEPHAFAYLDDIVVVTPTFEEHLEWLKHVLNRIREAGLTINPDKSKFCRSPVKYLGFLVQKKGLKVDPGKTVAILTTHHRAIFDSYVGLSEWRFGIVDLYRSAPRLEPLTRLLNKNHT